MKTPFPRFWSLLAAAALCLACWAGAVAVRRTVLDAQRMLNPGGEIPFTLESALAFRRIQQAGGPGGLPEHDWGIGWPAGIDVRATDTTGEEGVLLALARGLPWAESVSLAERVRWLHLLWWSLSIPALFLLVRRAGGGTAGAAVAAAFWAVAITAVARSTGQELSHENVAWPLWAWHLAFWTFADARGWRGRAALFQGIASALLLALALCAWDLVRYWLAFAGVWAVVRTFRGRIARGEADAFWGPLLLAMPAVAVFNPYHRVRMAAFPPLLLLLLAVPSGATRSRKVFWGQLALVALAALALAWVGSAVRGNGASPSYGHFASLLWAKLRFFNIRPTDPARLTFEQRILWTPALNSASPGLIREWLPALGWLGLLGAVWAFFKPATPRSSRSTIRHARFWAVFFAVSFAAFVLFFRFHVWAAWAACVLAGLAFGAAWRRGRVWRGAAAAVVLLAFGVEAWNTLLGFEIGKNLDVLRRTPSESVENASSTRGVRSTLPALVRLHALRWGRPNVYAVETAEMLDFLNREVAPEPVLANFGISGSIATYAGCPVVLHPKFETREIREAVRGYLEALFKGGENAFADWMDEHGATVYVHSMGELSNLAPEQSPRFMVDALDPAPDAAVRLFEQRPRDLKRFKLLFQNRKYRVFRRLDGPWLRNMAVSAELRAGALADGGRPAAAFAWAALALRIDPDNAGAQRLLQKLLLDEPEDDPYELSDDPAALEIYEPSFLAPSVIKLAPPGKGP